MMPKLFDSFIAGGGSVVGTVTSQELGPSAALSVGNLIALPRRLLSFSKSD